MNEKIEKRLIIIRGVQGSGKSTLADALYDIGSLDHFEKKSAPWNHFEADMYFVDKITGDYIFDGAKLMQAHRWCEFQVNDAMKRGDNIIVSNTFIKKKEFQPYIEMGEQYGYKIQEIICKGKFGNTHGVPETKIEEKRKAFEY